MTERTALYRVFGDADLLLYIGISKDFGRRWRDHARKQPWWGEMRRLSVDAWYASREEARAVEAVAIKAEKPKYNKKHSGKPEVQVRARRSLVRRAQEDPAARRAAMLAKYGRNDIEYPPALDVLRQMAANGEDPWRLIPDAMAGRWPHRET